MRRWATAALTALALAAVTRVEAQISPGPLSQPHCQLEGSTNCLKCHDPATGVSPPKCLSCHSLLHQRIEAGKGLHARPVYAVCAKCHVEHHGREFQLIFWGKEGREAFDHLETGFALQGKHARLACESCHPAKSQLGAAAARAGGASPTRTFLGVGTGCRNCHLDVHNGQFGRAACDTCHTQEAFKPPTAFHHDRTAFPLTGRHAEVACLRCHQQGRFKGTPTSCAGCHKDPHDGRLGRACATCHSTEGWSRLNLGKFDHSKTAFPLTGRHTQVACQGCHKHGKFKGIPFASCASCHRDPHEGRLGAACSTCHTTAAWSGLKKGGFDHDRTAYPLRGRHTRVPCDGCHGGGRRRPAFARCTDCHADRHVGQLRHRPDGGRCESCHDVEGFEPARFSIEDHGRTAYPLRGAHLAVPCDGCHREVPPERLQPLGFARGERLPDKTEQLRFASTRCTQCHQDPHRGQTSHWGACEECHRTEAWSAIAFDHARTRFKLEEGHARLPCRSCHPEQGGAVAFAGRPTTCAGCHKDPHGGQFARGGRTNCGRCHTAVSWARFDFDHDRETGFPLVGAHRNVPCAGCHRRHTPQGWVMRYSGLGKACTDCHATAGGAAPGR